jgi:tRNA pseudouridine38-40 synthase
MNNYKLTIEYDGNDFNGWQRQKNTSNTIQELIENSLSKLLKGKITIIGAGRTDTGVSALNQVANFKTERDITDTNKFLYSLNSILPGTICIKGIKKVPLNFHSRYSAKKRIYEYKISTRKRSVEKDYFYHLIYKLDFNLIDKLINILKGRKSFKSLCKNSSDKHNFYCNVSELKYVKKSDCRIIFKITSDRYLHSMVRAILGCLIDIGREKLDLNTTINSFNKGEKIKATYLPGNALTLKKIYY